MMVWVAANGGVRAIGDAGELTIQTADWRDCPTGPTLARPVDETLSGRVSSLTVPVRGATLTDAGGTHQYEIGNGVTLHSGTYSLACRPAVGDSPGEPTIRERPSDLELLIRFDGPAAIRREGQSLSLSFE